MVETFSVLHTTEGTVAAFRNRTCKYPGCNRHICKPNKTGYCKYHHAKRNEKWQVKWQFPIFASAYAKNVAVQSTTQIGVCDAIDVGQNSKPKLWTKKEENMPSLCSHCQHAEGPQNRCRHPAWRNRENVQLHFRYCPFFDERIPKQIVEVTAKWVGLLRRKMIDYLPTYLPYTYTYIHTYIHKDITKDAEA